MIGTFFDDWSLRTESYTQTFGAVLHIHFLNIIYVFVLMKYFQNSIQKVSVNIWQKIWQHSDHYVKRDVIGQTLPLW